MTDMPEPELGTTKTAAAVELWRPQLAGAVVAIGNAPTALFHLLERVADEPSLAPAAVLGSTQPRSRRFFTRHLRGLSLDVDAIRR